MKAGQLIRSFSRSMLDDSGAGELGTKTSDLTVMDAVL